MITETRPGLATPYKGLTYYSEEDAAFFFGRESETEIIIANLMASRLTLLYGESGVGKSSVLHAGAMRRLHQTARQNIEDWGQPEFVPVSFRSWQNDPIAGLRDAIRTSVAEVLPDAEPVEPKERLDEELFEWCARVDGDLILVFDQFEEYFLYHPNESDPGTFFVEFPRALNRGDLRVSFLIGIREDGLAKLDAFKGRIPNLFDNYLRIDHLSLKAARAAIEKPIEQWNKLHPDKEDVAIEEDLVDAVLEQVRAGQFFLGTGGAGTAVESKNGRGNVIETPFLQLVMTRLWEEELGEGSNVLRRETLERLGGAERIVRTHLDRVMGALPVEEQDLAADIFRQLVTPSGTKIAHALPDLAEYAERPESDLVPVIDHLSSSDVRVLRPVAPPPDQPGGLRYEIFHDVLAAAILDWRARWRQAEVERELEESRKEQERERRRARTFRAVAAIAAIVAAIAALLGIWAFNQKNEAVKQKHSARTQALAARSQQLAATSTSQLTLEPRLSVPLGLGAALAGIAAQPSEAGLLATKSGAQALRISLSESRVRAVLRGHANWVNTARFSPDGRYVLTASDDKTARVWDAATGAAVKSLPYPGGLVNYVVWSPDGKLVVAGGGKSAIVWNWQTGAVVRRMKTPDIVIGVASGGAHGEYAATASFDDVARIWNVQTGKRLWKKEIPHLHSVALDRAGRRLLTGSGLGDQLGRIFVWQQPKRKPVIVNAPDADGTHPQRDALNSAVFSADGRYVITGSEDKSVAVWNASDGEKLSQLYGPKDAVMGVSMSPNDKFVVAASRDGAIYLFDWYAEDRIAKILGHTDIVADANFSPDGSLIVSASGDRTARIWKVPPVVTLSHKQPVKWAAWSPDSKRIVTASAETEGDFFLAKIWNAQTGRVEVTLKGHTDWVTGAMFSPDGRYVATSSDDNTARVWDAQTGRMVQEFGSRKNDDSKLGHTDWVNSVAFSPDGRLVATTSNDGTARIWSRRTGKTIRTIEEPNFDSLVGAVFSRDGLYLLTTSGSPHDYTVKIWAWRRNVKKPFRTLKGHTGAVYEANWSHDGRFVVDASADRTAWVWDWRRERPVTKLVGESGALRDASFSPDDKLVATASSDGSSRVWDRQTGQALTSVKWHVDLIHSIAFSPDGSRLLTASDDWTADVFKCETCGALPATIEQARRRVRQTVTESELNGLLANVRCPDGKPVFVSYSSAKVCGRPLLAAQAVKTAAG